jgi:putative endonuclease
VTCARQHRGRLGERIAADRLARDGARLIGRNLRTRYGEIDLVAIEGGTLVFVEVKALAAATSRGPERPVLAVGPGKQLRLRRLAAAWLAERPRLPRFAEIRFDVIGMRIDDRGRVLEYEHLRNAF